jgi:FkbM family methyltransferase
MKINNSFVYNRVEKEGMNQPTIPTILHESYAQCYDDVVVCSALQAYQLRHGFVLSTHNLTYIEIGANHPVATSSTFLISKTFNVGGYLIEPNPELAEQLRKHRVKDAVIEAAVTTSDEETLDFFICADNEISSLDKNFVEKWSGVSTSYPGIKETITVKTAKVNDLLLLVEKFLVTILIIDVEGLDLQILKDIDYNEYRPYIIVVEPSEAYAPGTTNSMIEFMASKDYQLIGANFVNLIFQDKTKG